MDDVYTRPLHVLTPVRDGQDASATDLRGLLKAGWYVWAEHTPCLRMLMPGDQICFYATTKGVLAEAEVASTPEPRRVGGFQYDRERFNWRFRLRRHRFFPLVSIDEELRSKLDAFRDRDPRSSRWAWFVQNTRLVTAHDFALLTRP